MSCSIVSDHKIRVIAGMREDVPWQSLDQVEVVPLTHDDELFFIIRYYSLGRGLPPIVHSAWRTRTATQTFLRVNPGSEAEQN